MRMDDLKHYVFVFAEQSVECVCLVCRTARFMRGRFVLGHILGLEARVFVNVTATNMHICRYTQLNLSY